MAIKQVFATQIYHAQIKNISKLTQQIENESLVFAKDDLGGLKWSRENNYRGYTSYNSIPSLITISPTFASLEKEIFKHVKKFARQIKLPHEQQLQLNSLWINILNPGGFHTAHIHPLSVISGTYYVKIPKKSSAIKFEDPRLPLMMARNTKQESYFSIQPKNGSIVLFESWLRHEVPINTAKSERISVSFNYS